MPINSILWHARQCACGHITLKLGTVQMDFTKEQFANLHKLVSEAINEFQIAPSNTPLTRIETTRH
jgi:hypothetical protein